jgi:putative redox protein
LKVHITWLGDASFCGKTEEGQRVVMDGPPDHGGKGQGPRPMEMLLLGMGGCASFDVVHFLKKARQSIQSCETEITAERADTVPSVFTSIHLHFKVEGTNLSQKTVARMVGLSAEKYCSASIMLAKSGAQVSHSFEIQPA